nr:uncharacterized protein LOC110379190 [Helicoverpa armigera]
MVSLYKMRELLILLAAAAGLASADLPLTCTKPVYCNSNLLHQIQMARLYNDSKTFVDLQMNFDENKTLTDFETFFNLHNKNPTKEQLMEFVNEYFSNDNELEPWQPKDFSDNPAFLAKIKDDALREFGKGINNIWPLLARKVKAEVFQKPDQFSLVPLTHGFIIPGGRFKEIYYWDTFWIIEGLLISGMQETAKGMIENLIELLNLFGHIPNGSRWYYQQRSQPPMLNAMVATYYMYTKDLEFLRNNIAYLEKELDFWMDNRVVSVNRGGKNYTLLRYYAPSKGPRPESYYEDYSNTEGFSEEDSTNFYIDIKSAAESGWDFSTRWFLMPDGSNNGTLTDLHTRYIIPVDLNAIFAGAAQYVSNFHALLKNPQKAARYGQLAQTWRDNIQAVLWNDQDAMWYDFNIRDNLHRRYYYSSNAAPLWQNAVNPDFLKLNADRILKAITESGGVDFPGGVPTSLIRSGEQWDFPNVWPPEVSIEVAAIENIGTPEAITLAQEVAQTFVRSCHWGFQKYKQMFEKYDAETPGRFGGGGEYNVQFGFGWSNGVVLEFLNKYGSQLTADDSNNTNNSACVVMFKMYSPRYVPLYPVLGLLGACAQAINIVSVCNSSIYCGGDLLRTVQLARIFPDSKTFVDLRLANSEIETLANFTYFMKKTDNKPSREQIRSFVDDNFIDGDELFSWHPPDFDPNPPVLNEIADPKLRQFAKDIISIWPGLGRKVSPDVHRNSEQYSFIYVPNGFIVPGGRFKELYYWDSYWIIRGLLISNMTQTAKGMIENFIYLVDKLGYIPNGSRIYYLGRSQPPLLTLMVYDYFKATGDVAWLKQNIATVERELYFWLEKKKLTVDVKGKQYRLLRYMSDEDDTGPRPESYYEDYASSRVLSEDRREDFYREMRSAAESGWDFSSRWFVNAENVTTDNLTDVHASRILPVDLNSMFAGALQMVGDLRNELNDRRDALKWWSLAKYWRVAIDNVLWDPKDGAWYDYDTKAKSRKRHFYPSCATPLWADAVEPTAAPVYASRLVRYLIKTSALNFPGGIPTSLLNTGEQWDFPNTWPPLQSIMIGGLERSGYEEASKLAREQVKIWIRANYIGYTKYQKMFEKYSCVQPGENGSGGEYIVQSGFGWTNGIVLELLQRYGKELVLDENGEDDYPTVRMV